MELKAGIRPSNLALAQLNEVRELLYKRQVKINFSVVRIHTSGDFDKVTPLVAVERLDFFTKEIEQALVEGKIDIAVHSAKDLEEDIPLQLTIAAMTKSISPYECLISRDNFKLNELPAKAIVGTSSLKRKQALLNFRNDLIVKDIRGNIEERLLQLDCGNFDAIIVAHAALLRLGLEKRISQIIPKEIIDYHPLQGRLAIQINKKRADLQNIFKVLNDEN